MTTSQLLIRWIAMASLTIVSGLWQGKTLDTNLVLVAILAATTMTGLAAFHPQIKRPGESSFGFTWMRHLLIFFLIAAVLIGSSLRISIIMGIFASTVLTISRIP